MQNVTAQRFRSLMPLESHWYRRLSCAEYECPALLNPSGWRAVVEIGSPLEGALQQHIKQRRWRYTTDVVGSHRHYIFPAGTPCLQDGKHKRQMDRLADHVHEDVDTHKVTEMRQDSFFERWSEHLYKLERLRG